MTCRITDCKRSGSTVETGAMCPMHNQLEEEYAYFHLGLQSGLTPARALERAQAANVLWMDHQGQTLAAHPNVPDPPAMRPANPKESS